jgi:predicted nucleotidyltransferase component of viral defense system
VDRRLFILKGGCNLRFFFQSIRYSEDIDFDVMTVAKETLQKNIGKILESKAFTDHLKTFSCHIKSSNPAKQTDSTQRWKLVLSFDDLSGSFPTKIEFSRRGINQESKIETIDPNVLREYKLSSTIVNHYTKDEALVQKVKALARRNETQARDIFDLKLLLDAGANLKSIDEELKSDLVKASSNAQLISLEDYTSQVVSYLSPDLIEHHSQKEVWADIVKAVIDFLIQKAAL